MVLITEYPSETTDALGFAPIGLDEPYRVFMTRDPLGFAGGDVNLYRMTGNNPVRIKNGDSALFQRIS
jgi:hypothetical protein